MDVSNYWWQDDAAGGGPGGIGESLRFRGAQSLTRTPAVTQGNELYTYSAWVKNTLGANNLGLIAGNRATSGSIRQATEINLSAGTARPWTLIWSDGTNGTTFKQWADPRNPPFRDPSAWYHFVYQYDFDNQTMRAWVNGVALNLQEFASGPAWANLENAINFAGATQSIGGGFQRGETNPAHPSEGYFAEVHMVAGQLVAPTEFGEFDANGVWVPSNVNIADYGANGFYLDFSDPADIGADRSGNGNNFTPNGFELGDNTSELWDHMVDSPTQNWSTYNPLYSFDATSDRQPNFINANLGMAANNNPSRTASTLSTIGITQNVYAEVHVTNGASTGQGPAGDDFPSLKIATQRDQDNNPGYEFYGNESWSDLGTAGPNGTDAWTTGDIVRVAIDYAGRTCQIAVNNGAFVSSNISGMTEEPWTLACKNAEDATHTINYGQQPFLYTPPAGFEPLQTQNLPDAPVPNGREHFQAITDTGANILTAAQTAFSNGLWWIKDRDNSNQHQFVDSSRPDNSALICPNRVATPSAYVAPAGNSVAWCWSCPDTFTSAETGGLTVNFARRNVDAGFTMLDLSFPNSSANTTIEHGLGKPVDFFMHKVLVATSTWSIYHRSLGATGRLRMDTNAVFQVNSDFFNDTDPDENIITFGSTFSNNQRSMVYAWASVPGYSAFGSYTGNGNADGPFIYTGFRPAFLLIKNTAQATEWHIFDTQRDSYNLTKTGLYPSTTGGEVAQTNNTLDILSNGFKLRTSGGSTNGSGNTIIYACFSENPFGGSNVSPANAR